jgi:hypothetical protein
MHQGLLSEPHYPHIKMHEFSRSPLTNVGLVSKINIAWHKR